MVVGLQESALEPSLDDADGREAGFLTAEATCYLAGFLDFGSPELKRILLVWALVVGVLAVPATAYAVDLDQTVCEDPAPGGLGGTWVAGTSTCESASIPDSFTLTVPTGVTLEVVSDLISGSTITNDGTISGPTSTIVLSGGSLTNNGTLDLDALEVVSAATFTNGGSATFASGLDLVTGGSLINSGAITTLSLNGDDTSSIDNSGTLTATVAGPPFDLVSGSIDNQGTITAAGVNLGSNAAVENFGAITVAEVFGAVTNYGGATLTAATIDPDAVIQDVTIATTITPAPASGESPLTVDWTITLTNDGDGDLGSPQVELSTDGGTTAFATLVAPPTSGDTGNDGTLAPGETWSWTVQTTESADVTVTATGAANAFSYVLTFPQDPEARAAASVTVAAPTTTTTSTTTTTTVPDTTTTTVADTTTTTVATDVGAGTDDTLPDTGLDDDQQGLALSGGFLVLGGIVLVIGAGYIGRRRRDEI
jgi:hypothetical protein